MLDGDISAAVDHAADVSSTPANPAPSDTSAAPTDAPASGAPADVTADRSGFERPPKVPRSARATDDTSPRIFGKRESLDAGVPPPDRWPTVLENARTDTRNKLHEEYGIDGQRYSPEVVKGFGRMLHDFPDIDPHAVVIHATMLRVNPVEYHRQLTDQLARQGLLGGGGTPEPEREVRSRPDPSYRTPDGTPFYSGPDIEAYFDYVTDAISRRVEERLQPIETERMETMASDFARSQIEEMKTWPHFAEVREQMGRMMLADPRLTLDQAYGRLLRDRLKHRDSQIREETRTKTLEELRTAPDPNTPRPGRPTPSVAGRTRGNRSLASRIDSAFEKAVSHLNADG